MKKIESLLGRLTILALSALFSGRAVASAPLYLYHLSIQEFSEALFSDQISNAVDLPELKKFLSEKYHIQISTSEDLKGMVTVEDFELYRQATLSDTEFASASPTCICD